jgi:hypothetical protein
MHFSSLVDRKWRWTHARQPARIDAQHMRCARVFQARTMHRPNRSTDVRKIVSSIAPMNIDAIESASSR